jgi:hypothetical protein
MSYNTQVAKTGDFRSYWDCSIRNGRAK